MATGTPVSLCKRKVHLPNFLSPYWITTSSSVSHSGEEVAVAENKSGQKQLPSVTSPGPPGALK